MPKTVTFCGVHSKIAMIEDGGGGGSNDVTKEDTSIGILMVSNKYSV